MPDKTLIPDFSPLIGVVLFIFMIAVIVANALIFRLRAREDITQNPDLGPGYDKLVKGIIFWFGMPFAILAFGTITSGFKFASDFTNFSNPYLLAFFGWIVLIDLLGVRWIFFGDGAEFLSRHNKWANVSQIKPIFVKALMVFALIFHTAFFVGLWYFKENF